ncbi:MAG: metal-dependent hydrolase [Bacteroidales bacterium]|nr:metal-dependent hydrolase [Bacteroidales bacterium]
MDSLTHVVLGATVAQTVSNEKLGKTALLIGAIAGNIPDFDMLVTPFFKPADAMFVHRGFSHSFLLLVILAPLIAGCLKYLFRSKKVSYFTWLAVVGLPWFSHLIVDIFNTYGTALFEPFNATRISYDSVAIIDAVILLILIPTVILLFWMKNWKRKRNISITSVILVSLYFILSIFIKENLNQTVKQELNEQKVAYTRIYTTPLPLNNIIWLVLVENNNEYAIWKHNVVSGANSHINYIRKNRQLLSKIIPNNDVDKLMDFTKGFYSVGKLPNEIFCIHDLRFASLGALPPASYGLTFVIKKEKDELLVTRSHPKRNITLSNIANLINEILTNTNPQKNLPNQSLPQTN